jgi:Spy/CpxP family protein refolding chaperone
MMKLLVAIALGMFGVQQHDHAAMVKAGAGGTSSLSEQQVAQLLAGEGMGYARPAELNHYPGPRHVIELRNELSLTDAQRRQVEAAYNTMLASAKALGAQIVEAERALDASFRGGQIDEQQLTGLTSTAARLQGELRAVHLAAHLATRRALTPEQVARYDQLRGHSK